MTEIGKVVAQPVGDRAEKWRVVGSSRCRQNMEGVPVAEGGAREPSKHYQASLEQGTKPSKCPAMDWQPIWGCTLPSPTCAPRL